MGADEGGGGAPPCARGALQPRICLRTRCAAHRQHRPHRPHRQLAPAASAPVFVSGVKAVHDVGHALRALLVPAPQDGGLGGGVVRRAAATRGGYPQVAPPFHPAASAGPTGRFHAPGLAAGVPGDHHKVRVLRAVVGAARSRRKRRAAGSGAAARAPRRRRRCGPGPEPPIAARCASRCCCRGLPKRPRQHLEEVRAC